MSDAHVDADMRKHSRPAVELPVIVSDAINRVSAGLRLTAPGPGGAEVPLADGLPAFVRSDLLFEVGETLNLSIELPAGGPLVARGRVERIARGTAGDPLTGMAITLVDLPPPSRATLEAALR